MKKELKTYYIQTLGCKTNQIESNLIAEKFAAMGLNAAKTAQEADLYVLNSCSVTSNADNEALRHMRRQKKNNPTSYVVLTGCFAQLEGAHAESFDFIDLILGNTEKMYIEKYLYDMICLVERSASSKPDIKGHINEELIQKEDMIRPVNAKLLSKVDISCRVNGVAKDKSDISRHINKDLDKEDDISCRIFQEKDKKLDISCRHDKYKDTQPDVSCHICKTKTQVSDIFQQEKFIYEKIQSPEKTRAWLKVQDGCDNRCSYCTIWKARGKSRSAQPKDLLEQIQIYSDHGFQELVLTGIHIGQWGGEFSPKKGMLELVELVESSSIKRFRLGSLNPHELTRELLEHLSQSEKFCPHFHMSLQSACNKTLRAMNRHYTVEEYLEQIEFINEKFSLPFIGSDIIVGFPNETDEDFLTTYNNIEKSGLTTAHIFPYSIRKNTPAAVMEGQISQKIKSERLAKLKKLTDVKLHNFINKNINRTLNVLFEKSSKQQKEGETLLYKGLTENYLTVYAKSEQDIKGQILPCLIKSAEFTDASKDPKIYGELIKDKPQAL